MICAASSSEIIVGFSELDRGVVEMGMEGEQVVMDLSEALVPRVSRQLHTCVKSP